MKRIQELMNEAGLQPYYDSQEEAINKFAELLIKKACTIVNTWSDEEPDYKGCDILTVYKLKQHFGIDE